MIIQRLRSKRKRISLFLLCVIVAQVAMPVSTYALTSGPSQPEVQGFQPVGSSDMVDLFTGDFSYNIPLFELPGPNGGYPFNLAYQSGITIDQESTWVGLGWSLNPGAINRQMRGLPDEFMGDPVKVTTSIAPSVTVGLGAGMSVELFGKDGAEKKSRTNGKKRTSVGIGFNVTMNNYKGVSYSIDATSGLKSATEGGFTKSIGLGLSLDPKEGVGVSPSIGLGSKLNLFGLTAGYHSKSGLQNITASYEGKYDPTQSKRYKNRHVEDIIQTASLSLAHPSYIPQVSYPMKNTSVNIKVKTGGGGNGVYGSAYYNGSYNIQTLINNGKKVTHSAYGYLHYQDKSDPKKDLLDFNREKDGMVSKESPNLGIPSLTYDIYSVTGQGIGMMYRPMRNDYGVVHDQEMKSVSNAAGGGIDLGPPGHFGGNLNLTHSSSTSGPWTNDNQTLANAVFQKNVLNSAYENWYFKVHGENQSEDASGYNQIGGDKAVRVRLSGSQQDAFAASVLENKNWNALQPSNATVNRERKSRSQLILPYTNHELLGGSAEQISHFKVNYLDAANQLRAFNRSGVPSHHIAAYTALSPDGLRYNYGIPAYNLKQEEVSFSVMKDLNSTASRVNGGSDGKGNPQFDYDGTDKFMKTTELPPYAHSFLLTSIIGADYVDVTGDGVTSDDLGYWVKFTYRRTHDSGSPYRWRDPYSKAHLSEGWKTDPRDDKGNFTYGEKEIWYLAQAETKSHIAVFGLDPRQDGKGVASKLQDTNATDASLFALREITLYTRAAGAAHPIKNVKFEYDYSLCKNVFNNTNGNGKLTLKKVWFEYGNSQRGRLNPYEFTYHNSNPDYDPHAFDRWGTYKPYPVNQPMRNVDFPYSDQTSDKQIIDDRAASWSLTEIKLPSGGKIMVDYESDDYAYVQHKQATQMFQLCDPNTPANQSLSNVFSLNDASTKVRFKLEKPIPVTAALEGDIQKRKQEILKYLDQKRKQIYFKTKINLRSSGENFYEYVSGYADVDFGADMNLEKDASGQKYIYGYFHLVKESGFHPLSLRVWQHLRTNQPELANSGKKLEPATTNKERIRQIKSLGSIVAQVKQMFSGFNNFCKNKGWGRQVESSSSWVRLKSPDKTKYGGGLRVRQITMKDQWAHDDEGIYGQVYEYQTEEDGTAISSGVAAFEPMVGGEENALRYAKKYTQSVPLRSDNNLFFEYPVNESYFPGPHVGYRKVTVQTLASAHRLGKEVKNITLPDGKQLFPSIAAFGTTGMTVHEFYTAKDFPVITDETEKVNKPYQLNMNLPFVGVRSVSKLSSSQGYSIITNDMHGKQKKVSNYRQDKDGQLEKDPISWVEYAYRAKPIIYDNEKIFVLLNQFKENPDGSLSIPAAGEEENTSIRKYLVGQETEMFSDMRQYEDSTTGGGVHINTDIVFALFGVIPIPTGWPNMTRTKSQLRTSVINKVIFKTGILENTKAFDGGSQVITHNLKWDRLTGSPVLTSVNNNFNAPVFNYNIPAYTQYPGMGPAYQNSGLVFSVNSVQKVENKDREYLFSPGIGDDLLFPGDELLVYSDQGLIGSPLGRAVYVGKENGSAVLSTELMLTSSSYRAMVVRSGYRNQLSASAGTLTGLTDPSQPGTPVTYTKKILVPKK